MVLRLNRKWAGFAVFHFLLNILFVILLEVGAISTVTCGCLFLVFVVWEGLLAFKENKLFTPLTPSLIVEMSFSLYMMGLVKSYERLPVEANLMIVFCMFLWKVITLGNPAFSQVERLYEIEPAYNSRKSFTVVITVLFLVSVGAMLFEWKMAGGIPILRADSETFRFTVSYSAITHLLAIMNKIVAMLIGIFLVNQKEIRLRRDWLLILEFCISELLMIGTAMRGEMIMAPCVVFIFFAIKHKLPMKFYVIAAIVALAVIGLVPYARSLASYGAAYIESQKEISKYPQLYMFTPLYQSFADNFSILRLDLQIFPELRSWGFGAYTILPEIPFVDLGLNLMSVQNEVLNSNFYSGLTATFFASWYADFGYPGFVLCTLFYATIINKVYSVCVRKHDLFSFVLYAYTFYSALWIFYNGVIDFVYIAYCLVIWIVMCVRVQN